MHTGKLFQKISQTHVLELHYENVCILLTKKNIHRIAEWINYHFNDYKNLISMIFIIGQTIGLICDENLASSSDENKYVNLSIFCWGSGSSTTKNGYCFFFNCQKYSGFYQNILRSIFFQTGSNFKGKNGKFQKGNASIHTSHSAMEFSLHKINGPV